MARTVTSYLPTLDHSTGEVKENFKVEPYYYQIHFNDNERFACVGCPVKIVRQPGYEVGYVKNPKVDLSLGLEGNNSLVPYNVVNLPPIGNGLESLNDGDEFKSSEYFSKYNKPNDEFWLNTPIDSQQCKNHPLVAEAGETESKLRTDAYKHVETAFPPLFGRSRNSVTGEIEFLLFDPHLEWQENTVENPASDGGGRRYFESNAKTWCSNAPRSFLNEEHCEPMSIYLNMCQV